MAIDRSKFKSTSMTRLKQQEEETSSLTKRSGGGRAGMLELSVGKNKFRIYPGHPKDNGEEADFSLPCVRAFLPMMADERDKDGNLTGNKKEINKPVFNSRIHAGTPKDLVEEYIKMARAYAESKWNDKDPKEKVLRQTFLDNIYGKYSKIAADRKMGINYKTSYVMYADKILPGDERQFGRLEVKESVRSKMNTLAAQESSDQALEVDPYTDLDEGRCVVIYYNDKATQASDYYTTSIDADADKATRMLKVYPIDDEMLEKFAKQPSLESMYVNSFTRKDFELQMQGLEYFDKKYNNNLFGTDAWAEIVEEINEYYPTGDEEETKELGGAVEGAEEVEEVVEATDAYSLMNRLELKTVIAKNKLAIVVKPSISDDSLRELIREAMEEKAEEFRKDLVGEEVEDMPVVEEVKETAPEKPKVSALERLRGMKKS